MIDGREMMVERLQAHLAEVGFDHVKVAMGQNDDLLFTFDHYGSNHESARRGVWRASALLFPFSHVCWDCFESNAGFGVKRHCGSCHCCPN